MFFTPGQTILRRYFRGGRVSFLNVCRVLADDERGLRMWLPIGTPFWRLLTPDGRDGHSASVEEMVEASLGELTWRGSHVMIFMPPGAAHSIWWFFSPDGEFEGWYGNLEEPCTRWDGGVDTEDHALDLWFEPDRSWRWKDEAEFTERIGNPKFWTVEQAARIRAEGQRLAALAEAGRFPFDGTWCDLRPDPNPPELIRPDDWDRPRVDRVLT
jgi:predicted RNA-binding protein associated with RNAse of E/G family